ncbi:MAG: hypothetical protein VX755_11595 [Pseudomonadota bacterium]|nr:hypothetical protein [Pseudomonadota bacterium]MED5538633.1 hypothetical protein [Pseudomonadota bacterium]
MDDKDVEIARLKGQIEGMQQAASAKPRPKSEGDQPNRVGILILLVVLAIVGIFLATAWNSGKQQAKEDEAFTYPCQLASEKPAEAQACVDSMKAMYKGPLDDPDMVANAAAEHVRRYREGR